MWQLQTDMHHEVLLHNSAKLLQRSEEIKDIVVEMVTLVCGDHFFIKHQIKWFVRDQTQCP